MDKNQKIAELKEQLAQWVRESNGITSTIELGCFELGIGELELTEQDVKNVLAQWKKDAPEIER
jgi:hypothetical protein